MTAGSCALGGTGTMGMAMHTGADAHRDSGPVPVPPSHPLPPPRTGWPLRAYHSYDPVPQAVGAARNLVRAALHAWQVPISEDRADDLVLIASELLANAVVASGAISGPQQVKLWICSDGSRILIQVGDRSPRTPQWIHAGPDADSGRGLAGIVAPFSTAWGWHPATAHGLAKIVWSDMVGRDAKASPQLPKR